MLFGLPLGGYRHAKLATRRPKTARRRPKMAPRCAQDAPRLIQDAPARGQDDPRWAKMAHDGFKMVQDGSIPRKMAQDGPSMTSRWPPVRRWIGMCQRIFFYFRWGFSIKNRKKRRIKQKY